MKDGIIFALIVLLVILSLADEGGPRALIDATPADYEQCAKIKNAPLLRSPDNSVDYRVGNQFNDKGIT